MQESSRSTPSVFSAGHPEAFLSYRGRVAEPCGGFLISIPHLLLQLGSPGDSQSALAQRLKPTAQRRLNRSVEGAGPPKSSDGEVENRGRAEARRLGQPP